jgi:predicted HTH domain antitoxin
VIGCFEVECPTAERALAIFAHSLPAISVWVLGRRSSGTVGDILAREGEEETMPVVTIDLPEEVYATLRRSPRELALDVRLAAAIDWYRRGLISQGRGAEIAGVPRADFIDALATRKIDVVQVDLDALERDLEHA